MGKTKKSKKAKLLPHESQLLAEGGLIDITHKGASSRWLSAPSKDAADNGRTLCYRHMGDIEFSHLLEHNQLPSTQPYQTITRGPEGRLYCEKYLRSNKFVDTFPSTVVEFDCAVELIDDFYSIQSKIEDGTRSHGIGHKASRTLSRFNDALHADEIHWRIVLVKRSISS